MAEPQSAFCVTEIPTTRGREGGLCYRVGKTFGEAQIGRWKEHVLDTLNVGLVMGRADRRHLGLRILSQMHAPALTGSASLGVEEVASADGKAASQGD